MTGADNDGKPYPGLGGYAAAVSHFVPGILAERDKQVVAASVELVLRHLTERTARGGVAGSALAGGANFSRYASMDVQAASTQSLFDEYFDDFFQKQTKSLILWRTRRIRTPGLCLRRAALIQLSYGCFACCLPDADEFGKENLQGHCALPPPWRQKPADLDAFADYV